MIEITTDLVIGPDAADTKAILDRSLARIAEERGISPTAEWSEVEQAFIVKDLPVFGTATITRITVLQ